MRVSLDLGPVYEAEIKQIAKEVDATPADVLTAIVKMFVDNRVIPKKRGSPRPIQDQYGTQYASVKEACNRLGLHEALVHCVLRGTRASTGGYSFKRI